MIRQTFYRMKIFISWLFEELAKCKQDSGKSDPDNFYIRYFHYFCRPNLKINAMNEEAQFVLDEAAESMQNALKHFERELQKIRAGKANPQMLESVKVDYYGVLSPIDQISNINTPDPRQIIVQPWDKNMLTVIEKAIMAANLGFNPQNNGEVLRIIVPALTEERRRDLVKMAKNETENARVTIRNIRRSANDSAKKLEKLGVPEDEVKQLEKEIQVMTDRFIARIEQVMDAKEKDIMTV